jgi:hypothetical protein
VIDPDKLYPESRQAEAAAGGHLSEIRLLYPEFGQLGPYHPQGKIGGVDRYVKLLQKIGY